MMLACCRGGHPGYAILLRDDRSDHQKNYNCLLNLLPRAHIELATCKHWRIDGFTAQDEEL